MRKCFSLHQTPFTFRTRDASLAGLPSVATHVYLTRSPPCLSTGPPLRTKDPRQMTKAVGLASFVLRQ